MERRSRLRLWHLAACVAVAACVLAMTRLDGNGPGGIKAHFAMLIAPGFACYLLTRKVILPLAMDARGEFRFGRPGPYGPIEFASEVAFWAAAAFLAFFPIAFVFLVVGACTTAALGLGGR